MFLDQAQAGLFIAHLWRRFPFERWIQEIQAPFYFHDQNGDGSDDLVQVGLRVYDDEASQSVKWSIGDYQEGLETWVHLAWTYNGNRVIMSMVPIITRPQPSVLHFPLSVI